MKNCDQKKALGTVLRAGLALSLLVMVVGLAMFAFDPSEDEMALQFHELPGALAELRPAGVLNLGILMLIATPFIGLLSVIISFTMNKEKKFVIISFVVLLLLLLSLALSILRQG